MFIFASESPRREFVKLLAGAFVSQSGSHFLTITLAGFVLVRTKSLTQASLVFVLSYLPSLFVSARVGDWIDRRLSRWLLGRNELFGALTSLACGVCIAYNLPTSGLCIVMGV